MVTGTLKLKELISWSVNFEIVREDEEIYIYYYPDPNRYFKVKLDKNSLNALKQKRDQLIAFLESSVTLSGDIVERWEKKTVTKTETVEEWVRVE